MFLTNRCTFLNDWGYHIISEVFFLHYMYFTYDNYEIFELHLHKTPKPYDDECTWYSQNILFIQNLNCSKAEGSQFIG